MSLDDVQRAAHDYEKALVAGDSDVATAWFETDPGVSRIGPGAIQLGPDAVAAARAAQGAQPEPGWVVDEVRELAPDVALHLAVLTRGEATIQRTQVWRRGADGWKIAHAHVTRIAGTVEVQR